MTSPRPEPPARVAFAGFGNVGQDLARRLTGGAIPGLRLTAVAAIVYMVPKGIAEPWQYAICAFDGAIALVYIIGMIKHTGASFPQLLLAKTN